MKKFKNNKGISITGLVITIMVLLLIASLSILILVRANEFTKTEKEGKQETNAQVNCEHDWVVTSQYSFWFNCYRTVSKCSKCGKVVK